MRKNLILNFCVFFKCLHLWKPWFYIYIEWKSCLTLIFSIPYSKKSHNLTISENVCVKKCWDAMNCSWKIYKTFCWNLIKYVWRHSIIDVWSLDSRLFICAKCFFSFSFNIYMNNNNINNNMKPFFLCYHFINTMCFVCPTSSPGNYWCPMQFSGLSLSFLKCIYTPFKKVSNKLNVMHVSCKVVSLSQKKLFEFLKLTSIFV